MSLSVWQRFVQTGEVEDYLTYKAGGARQGKSKTGTNNLPSGTAGNTGTTKRPKERKYAADNRRPGAARGKSKRS